MLIFFNEDFEINKKILDHQTKKASEELNGATKETDQAKENMDKAEQNVGKEKDRQPDK